MENEELEPEWQKVLEEAFCRQIAGMVRYARPIRRIVCPGCGREFYTQERSRKYCQGEVCARLYRRKLREQARSELVCACCGKVFHADRKDAKFCSNACRQKAYRESRAAHQSAKLTL